MLVSWGVYLIEKLEMLEFNIEGRKMEMNQSNLRGMWGSRVSLWRDTNDVKLKGHKSSFGSLQDVTRVCRKAEYISKEKLRKEVVMEEKSQ